MTVPVFNTFLCKVASRCNLDCGYCYMYHHADQSWQRRPHFMSEETFGAFAGRLAVYAKTADLDKVTILLHGGEPLLFGPERMKAFFETVVSALRPFGCTVEFAMQTNGVLLSYEWLDLLDEWNATFGISLDGDRMANDRWRLDHGGKSSYDRIMQTLHLVKTTEKGRRLFRGLLSVIDVRNDPLKTYYALRDLEPPRLDFLFPEGTHENPPVGIIANNFSGTPYADWLIAVFDDWFNSNTNVRIRLFENLMDVILGGRSQTEGTGEGHLNLLTVETDGEIEDVDLMKAAYPGAGALLGTDGNKATVFSHTFKDLAMAPEFLERHRLHGFGGLSATCQSCPIVRACGGGLLAHRWSNERGFDNPSVYCRDLFKLIKHIGRAVGEEVKAVLTDTAGVSPAR